MSGSSSPAHAPPRTSTRPSVVAIEALSVIDAPHRVSSTAIEDALAGTYARLGIPAGCIETLVGIQARRFWDPGVAIADVAAEAAAAAFQSLGAREAAFRDATGFLVSTSVCKDYIEPSNAALVHAALGLPASCQSLDVSNACLGFLNGIEVARNLIESGRVQVAVVVAAESSRHVVERTVAQLCQDTSTMDDFKEALATLTLGSGAVAMILCHESLSHTAHRVGDGVTLADPASSRICLGTAEWMKTDATKLLHNGVDLAARTWALATERLGFSADALQQFICHQVGATHMATLFQRLGLPLQRAFLTFPEFGNIGPAAVPITLRAAVDAGAVQAGDRVALMGIGSGLNCAMLDVRW